MPTTHTELQFPFAAIVEDLRAQREGEGRGTSIRRRVWRREVEEGEWVFGGGTEDVKRLNGGRGLA